MGSASGTLTMSYTKVQVSLKVEGEVSREMEKELRSETDRDTDPKLNKLFLYFTYCITELIELIEGRVDRRENITKIETEPYINQKRS